MATIDDLLPSVLISEISSKLGAQSSSGRKVVIPFEAIELASQVTFGTESEVVSLMDQLATAKNWEVKVYFFERKVVIND